jgi:ABC-type molybdate transport system ATPase subunit
VSNCRVFSTTLQRRLAETRIAVEASEVSARLRNESERERRNALLAAELESKKERAKVLLEMEIAAAEKRVAAEETLAKDTSKQAAEMRIEDLLYVMRPSSSSL